VGRGAAFPLPVGLLKKMNRESNEAAPFWVGKSHKTVTLIISRIVTLLKKRYKG
jgi:hypothetical protein